MTSQSMKRPSSARRHINLETFNQFVSGARLAKIQSLLKGNNPDSNSPESIVCITGIDSRYNEGSQQLVNYLLFGFFSTRKQELERSGFPEEAIDDLIMVINSNSIDIYCNVINYHYLLPYTCHWLNVRYHCLTDQQAEVEEAEEEFKMFSFVTMVKNKNTIAVPYFPTGHVGKFDKMVLEKWPLIQAFALDEIGGGGFFTMKHEVEDISSKVHEFYSHIDTVSLETILTQNLPLLTRQWDNMETRVSLEISSQVDKLTENIAAEALMSYYKHGHMIDSQSPDSRYKYPFVLFGCHSNESEIKKCRNGLTENNKSLLTSGINNGSPKLMVCQAVSPNSPVVCSRTYFFTSILNPFSVFPRGLPTGLIYCHSMLFLNIRNISKIKLLWKQCGVTCNSSFNSTECF
ncbi:hypothetical protein LOTGIDRAFT_231758 [Lottia gigantea]|uniref:Uncharacterized protein n=1 Tax=Lottia gigantea TaxID=225164 RepID=V4AQC1_LOTGI|nr:hypothetical protein LOTGIDRAFT_231758 [Lottia gigantea]ESO97010.1 hypothetical protein LOTGIDRAFT_231758 [Lottia gigantea]